MKKDRLDLNKDWYDVKSIEITRRMYRIGIGKLKIQGD